MTEIEDLSAFIIAGRVKARPSTESETAARTPAQGVQDAVEAERIGFRRVFLSERWNLKEAGVILGAAGALTSRIGLGTGVLFPGSRHPLHAAALGATMQATFGPRFVLGMGRGDTGTYKGTGMAASGGDVLVDYIDIVRRLWQGETVDYDGPLGRYPRLVLADRHEGPDPEIWFGSFGLPLGAKVAARSFDGVLLPPSMTPEATAGSVARIRTACEQIGRNPASIRIAQCVTTAPDLDDLETRQIAHGRAVTYLQAPVYRDALIRVNGWDPAVVERLANHEQFRGSDVTADNRFHRAQLLGPAELIPEEWMQESCALGSVERCVAQLRRFRDAGADEIVTYGSTPGQNAKLAEAWA